MVRTVNRLRFTEKVLITVQAEYLWSRANTAQKSYRIYRALFKLNIYLAHSLLFLFIMQQNNFLFYHETSISPSSKSSVTLLKVTREPQEGNICDDWSVKHMPKGAAKWAFCIFSEVTKGWRERGLWILLTSCPLEILAPCAPSPLSPTWKQELYPPIATLGRVDTLVWK